MILIKSHRVIPELPLWDKRTDKYIPFILWKKQVELLNCIHTYRKIILLKKRQVGASQMVGADSLIQCMMQENFTVLILSKTGDDADEFLGRIKDMYKGMDDKYKAHNPVIKGLDGGSELKFASGSRIKSLPAVKGRGMTANRVVLDEAAFMDLKHAKIKLEDVLKGIEATVEKAGGQLILISTANGLNKFQNIFVKAMQKLNSFYPFFFTCWDDPTFTKKDRQRLINDYGEDHVNQEHPRNWEEAFLSSGRPRFDNKTMELYKTKKLIKPIAKGNITIDGVVKNDNGYVTFYKTKGPKKIYAIFADVAEGLEKGDYSVAKVFDVNTWDLIAEWHGHIEPALFGTILYLMALHYNNAYICPECNNHGGTTINQIKNVHDYPRTLIFQGNYTKEKADDDFKDPQKRYGWHTTRKTKPMIINNLAKMLVGEEIPGLTEEDISECTTYIIDSKGSTNADENYFDDRVMTIAIAYYILNLGIYVSRETTSFECCEHCNNFIPDKFICSRVNRPVKDDSFCPLYDEIDYEIRNFRVPGSQKRYKGTNRKHNK